MEEDSFLGLVKAGNFILLLIKSELMIFSQGPPQKKYNQIIVFQSQTQYHINQTPLLMFTSKDTPQHLTHVLLDAWLQAFKEFHSQPIIMLTGNKGRSYRKPKQCKITDNHWIRKKSPFAWFFRSHLCTLSQENCKINLPLASENKKHFYGTWFLKKQGYHRAVELGLTGPFRRYNRFSSIKVIESFTKKEQVSKYKCSLPNGLKL